MRVGDCCAAEEVLRAPGITTKDEDTFQLQVKRSAQQRGGDIDFVELIRTSLELSNNSRLPESSGALRFESPKIARQFISGRGQGVVATEPIEVGELLIVARPLGFVRPGDDYWQPDVDLEDLLTSHLQKHVVQDAQLATEVFSLFDGSNGYGPDWQPREWDSASETLPQVAAADSDELKERLHSIVQHNAHLCYGRDPVTGRRSPSSGLWLWPPMVNHGVVVMEDPTVVISLSARRYWTRTHRHLLQRSSRR